jgi:aryl carrier-like protein
LKGEIMSTNNNSNEHKSYIKKIVIGIRFKKTFRLLDNAGSIVDTVLSDEYFDTKYYTNCDLSHPDQKVLYNKEKHNTLKILASDIILEHNIETSNFKKEFNNVIKHYNSMIKKVLHEFEIKNIMRLGLVFEHEYDDSVFTDKILSKVVNSEFAQPKSIRFAYNKPVQDSLLKKGLDSFYNVIVSTSVNDDGSGLFSYDFQLYLKPTIEVITQIHFQNDLIQAGLKSLELDYERFFGD